MTGWIIFGAIVLFIMIILWQSITVTFDYENKLNLKVKFLFFTIYTTDPKKQKKKKEKKSRKEKNPPEKQEETPPKADNSASEESSDNKTADKQTPPKKKKKLDIDLEMIMDYVESASPPVKRLFKKIRWYDIYVDWVVATDDAAKTALTYGSICSVLYPFFKWLTTYFTAHVKEVNVEADFSKEESDIFAYFLLKLRLSTALACIIWLAVRLLKTYSKYNQQPTQPKQKSKQTSRKKGK